MNLYVQIVRVSEVLKCQARFYANMSCVSWKEMQNFVFTLYTKTGLLYVWQWSESQWNFSFISKTSSHTLWIQNFFISFSRGKPR